MVHFCKEKREREKKEGESEKRRIISRTNNGRVKRRPRISYAHASARGELYDEPAGTRDPIISGIHIMPWATSSHKAATCTPPSRLYLRGQLYKRNLALAIYVYRISRISYRHSFRISECLLL